MAREVTFNNRLKAPTIGLGTWQNKGEKVKTAIWKALDVGYRHIDSAFAYENEADIGGALNDYFKSSKLTRDDVFITSKLAPIYMDPSMVKTCLEKSLKNLQVSYLDLFLIHLPTALKNHDDGNFWPKSENGELDFHVCDLLDTWKKMEELVDEGKVKSIGVSNFNSKQVERICKYARIKPVTNQIECHIYLQQEDLQKLCQRYGVVITAYSPFGSPDILEIWRKPDHPVPLKDLVINDMARKYNKTPAQILLQNLLQRGMIVLPKSSNPNRIEENFQVLDFTLTDKDMETIAKLDKKKRLYTFDIGTDLTKHPEYPFNIPF